MTLDARHPHEVETERDREDETHVRSVRPVAVPPSTHGAVRFEKIVTKLQ